MKQFQIILLSILFLMLASCQKNETLLPPEQGFDSLVPNHTTGHETKMEFFSPLKFQSNSG